MIKEWIEEYRPRNENEVIDALREIMQEIALAGLSRTDFFEKAAFYGGTALRIFYGLDRYSEDLDFSLLVPDPEFSMVPYFDSLLNEFAAMGISVRIDEKKKTKQTNIDSAFLKADTIWKEIVLEDTVERIGIRSNRSIKIKLEIDRQPPPGFITEERLLVRPFSFYVKCFSKSDLFAGKLHALLFRKRKNRVKGRDWYDLEWYVKAGISLNSAHFCARANASGDWQKSTISPEEIKGLLSDKIASVSFKDVKLDVERFVKDDTSLKIWSASYFQDIIDKMNVL